MEELLDHDPDAYALLMVQQWLHERGHTKALHSLEEECGLRHDPDKLRQGSTLMQGGRKLQRKRRPSKAENDGYTDAGAANAEVADTLLAVTSMDGTVSVLSAASGQLICSAKPHRKYVVKACWLPADGGSCLEAGGARLATVSHDQTICFLQVPAPPHEEVQVLRQVPAASTPTDIALVGSGTESTLIVSLRDTNYLRRFSMQAPEAAELDPVNMNASGDDHISFSALHLSASGCGRYLLASTDQARILMFSTTSWRVVRSFYGLSTEQFHTPCAAWHHDGRYIYAAGAGGVLFIYEVGSAKVLATVKVHNVNIRHMVYDLQSRQLFTCSYDKTVKALRGLSSSGPGLGADD